MTKQQWAQSAVSCYGDVIEGDPWYDQHKPEAFKGHVNRLVTATRPHEERWLLRDFLRNNGFLSGAEAKKLRQAHEDEVQKLHTLAKKGMALKAIAKALKRSEESTKDRAKADGLSIAKLR